LTVDNCARDKIALLTSDLSHLTSGLVYSSGVHEFTKVFRSMLESTIWAHPWSIKGVWFTMLLMADRDGCVEATLPGLAVRACVPLEDCAKAIEIFLAPDKYSRTPDNEGRRIEAIEGGWRLLNHDKYRALGTADHSRRKAAERQRRYDVRKRQGRQITRQGLTENRTDRQNDGIAEAEAEAERLRLLSAPPSPKSSNPLPHTHVLARARARACVGNAQAGIAEKPGEKPTWWDAACDTAEQSVSDVGDRLGRWLQYDGNMEQRGYARTQGSAAGWLVTVVRRERTQATKVPPAPFSSRPPSAFVEPKRYSQEQQKAFAEQLRQRLARERERKNA
jgi:hypothetical protein